MSASDHLSKYQLLRHVAKFKKTPMSNVGFEGYGTPDEEFSDPSCAEGECNTARAAFQRHLYRNNAPHGMSVGFNDTDGDDFEHYASEHNVSGVPHIVDFTYRQLEPQSRYPLIMPSSQYEEKMKTHRLTRTQKWDPKEAGEVN